MSHYNQYMFEQETPFVAPHPDAMTKTAAMTTMEGGVSPARFRHDPYAPAGDARVLCHDAAMQPAPQDACAPEAEYAYADFAPAAGDFHDANVMAPPAGTLHMALWGQVSFVPYPDTEFAIPAEAYDAVAAEGGQTARCFVGQLPYFVTDMQLAWLCYTFGNGHVVSYPERIMKRQANGERLPTGCVHAYCTQRAVAEMADGMHKRMLIDDTGVWHAQSEAEWVFLADYVTAMKRDKTKRFPNRPYDTVVVQFATSTFVPAAPMPLTEMPVTKASVKAAKAAARAAHTNASADVTPRGAGAQSPAPPTYAEAVETLPPQYVA